jgi:kynurenine formamidase
MRAAWPLVLLTQLITIASATEGVRLPAGARIIDLTHTFDEHTPYWPESPPDHFKLSKIVCGKDAAFGFFICMNRMSAPEHGGTHLDAPSHFAEKHASVDQVALSRLIGPAVVIDMTAAVAASADARLGAADVIAFEKAHGRIARDSIVLVRTGWVEHYSDARRYFGTDKLDDSSNLHFPGIGEDAARLLVERGIGAVGIDGPSIDPGQAKTFAAHQVLLGADIPQLENVASMKELPATGTLIIALPMKIGGGTGAPLRIVAVLPPR